MRCIQVTFSDGDKVRTMINGTEEEIRSYYLAPGQVFNLGHPGNPELDNVQRAVSVEFLDSFDQLRCQVAGPVVVSKV